VRELVDLAGLELGVRLQKREGNRSGPVLYDLRDHRLAATSIRSSNVCANPKASQ